MVKNSCLGIHYSDVGITAVIVEKPAGRSKWDRSTLGRDESDRTFKLATGDSAGDQAESALIEQLAQQLLETQTKLPPVALALGGAFYQTQFHHSEFTDERQLRQTLRFDVEEDFAVDADSVNLCFQHISSEGDGSELLVHTTDGAELRHLLENFDRFGLDALIAQPDIVSWAAFLADREELPDARVVAVVAWAVGTLYLLVLARNRDTILARTILCRDVGQAHEILTVELRRSLALLPSHQRPETIFYHPGDFTDEQMGAIQNEAELDCQPLSEPDVTRAFAAGAALAWLAGRRAADFRADGLEPRSLATARRYALFGLSAVVSLLLLILIIVMNSHAGRHRDITDEMEQQTKQAWLTAFDDKALPRDEFKIPSGIKNRLNELRRAVQSQAASSLPGSASHTLMLALQALSSLPADFDIFIETLRVYTDYFTLSGSVPTLADIEKLHETCQDNPTLEIGNWTTSPTGSGVKGDPTNRRSFDIQLRLAKPTRDTAKAK